MVAAALNQAGLGTLLADLLTPEEELRRANVFDVRLLAARLTGSTRWLHRHPAARGIPLGYFGASTGAAAALWAAAADPRVPIAAVVSRGGRPDLAGPQLASVRAPTLLIVGGSDEAVLDLNRQARQQLTCENELPSFPVSPACSRSQGHRTGGGTGSRLVHQPPRGAGGWDGPGRMSVPSGWRLIRVPKSRLIRSSTSGSHWLSAVLAWHSRIFLACIGTIRSASSAPVSAATDGKYSRRRSSRNSSWPLMPS